MAGLLPDVYVKFEDLDGECLDEKHLKWIAISDFTFGFNLSSSGRPPPVTLKKRPDLASTELLGKCHGGEIIPKVEVEACRYGGEKGDEKIPFLRLTFDEVHLKSCSVEFSEDAELEETVTFEYKTVSLEYIWTSNDTGSRVRGASAPRASWTLVENVEPEASPEGSSS